MALNLLIVTIWRENENGTKFSSFQPPYNLKPTADHSNHGHEDSVIFNIIMR